MESVTRSKTEGERALSKEQRQTEWRVTIRDRPQTGCHTQTHTDTTTHNQKERRERVRVRVRHRETENV